MHLRSHSPILYFGTPVVLISSQNPDGTTNLAPISSIFWLGWRAVIGIGAASQTAQNIRRTGECVLNLACVDLLDAINRLALTTGVAELSEWKRQQGYQYVADKFSRAGLSRQASCSVAPARVVEAKVQQEAVLVKSDLISADTPGNGMIWNMEFRITALHIAPELSLHGNPDRINPDAWPALMMSFQKFYSMSRCDTTSRLASIDENAYAGADLSRARRAQKERYDSVLATRR